MVGLAWFGLAWFGLDVVADLFPFPFLLLFLLRDWTTRDDLRWPNVRERLDGTKMERNRMTAYGPAQGLAGE